MHFQVNILYWETIEKAFETYLIPLSLSLSFTGLLSPTLMPRGQEVQLCSTSSSMLPTANVAAGGGGEIKQPHFLPTHPRSVPRKQYNQMSLMGPEGNSTTVLPPLWLLCVLQS